MIIIVETIVKLEVLSPAFPLAGQWSVDGFIEVVDIFWVEGITDSRSGVETTNRFTAIVADDQDRALAQTVIDATPQDVKDFASAAS